ncbi:MAG: sugar phosphate isomerase/epimerase [Chloroflexi bacterium]|nr:sugar phosphate isomerase/epimerase [Chloroflexota bacterium]
MHDLALSTMWGIGRFPSLGEFFPAADALGFACFELNHAVDSAMLDGLNLNGYRIVSLHEPCPADVSTATLRERNWLISAPDEANRQQGVAAIQRSIDLAGALGAQVVIVHPGKVDIDYRLDLAVGKLYREGKAETPEYVAAKERLMAARAAQAEVNLSAVRRSVRELAEYAGRRGLKLGLENRYHYYEIPLPDELDSLLSLGDDEVIGYWYDVGHAQTLDRLGFCPHEEWLRRFASRMIGVHLHDAVGIGDHRPAGSGQVDWGLVARYLPPGVLRTCEFQNDNSPQAVAEGVQWLVKTGCVGPAR